MSHLLSLPPGVCHCDLIFQVADTTDYSQAICTSTAPDESVKFDHVGVILLDAHEAYVIEASALHGVVSTPYAVFVAKLTSGFVIKRVTLPFSPFQVVNLLLSNLGKPYNWSFHPHNGRFYCSQLVQSSFLDLHGEAIFPSRPMNFCDSEGQMPQFWTDLFSRLGETIPEGLPGTNPNDMAKEPFLQEIYRSFPIQ